MPTVLSVATVLIVVATSGLAEDRYSIEVAKPLKFVLHHRTDLISPCRTTKPIFGCTLFAEQHLYCSCERDGNRWRLNAKASLVPAIFLYERRPDVVDHEHLHIEDVRARLAEYLESLTSRTFATEEKCTREAKAVSEPTTFVRRMNEFCEESNQKLD